MNNKKLIIILIVGVVILASIVGICAVVNSNSLKKLEDYKGYWYVDNEQGESVEYTELSIKEVNKKTITFDYTISMLCNDKNIKVEIKNGKGEFKTEQSEGTIKLENNKVELKVKNMNYEKEFEKVFSYKSLDSRNGKLLNNRNVQEKIVGEWQIKEIYDVDMKEYRGNSQHFGIEIAEKYHFEFYNDGTYVKLLGSLDERGTYRVVDDKVYMTSNSNKQAILEFTEDTSGNVKLTENEGNGIRIYYVKSL